jgi:hypothetical protein
MLYAPHENSTRKTKKQESGVRFEITYSARNFLIESSSINGFCEFFELKIVKLALIPKIATAT